MAGSDAAQESLVVKRIVPSLAIMVIALGVVVTCVATVTTSLALSSGAVNRPGQPIEVTAGTLSIKFGKGSARAQYQGNVTVKQGDVTMTCERLVVDYDVKGTDPRNPKLTRDMQTVSSMRSITASGNVKIVQGDRRAEAGKAVFDNSVRTVELTENPRLWQGPDRLIGKKIVIYIDENRIEMDAVETRIPPAQPKKEQEK